MAEHRRLEQWPHLLQFAGALAVLLGVLLSLLLLLVGPLLQTAATAFISCLWPAAFFAWGSWRLARLRAANWMAACALLNLLLCALGLVMGLLLLTVNELPAPWDVLYVSISLALIGSQLLLLWELLRRSDSRLIGLVKLLLCAAIAVAVGMSFTELWQMLALVYAVLIGGPWLWFLLQQRLRGVDTAGRGLRLLLCTLAFLMPVLLSLVDLGQRIHAARATLIGTWTGITAERRLNVVFGADGSVQITSVDAPAVPHWTGHWSIRPMPFSETPELLVYRDDEDVAWWSQYESGTQELFMRGDSTVLLRRHPSAPTHVQTNMPRSMHIDCGKSERQWRLQLDADQRGQLQRLSAGVLGPDDSVAVFWLNMPDGWQPGIHVLIDQTQFAEARERALDTPVQLHLAIDQTIRLDYQNGIQRSCTWRAL